MSPSEDISAKDLPSGSEPPERLNFIEQEIEKDFKQPKLVGKTLQNVIIQ